MSVRKNAKFLTPAERQSFVKACVLMKADIVNPADAVAAQYSRWDEFVAIHQMIQNAFAPGDSAVNFGHGGNGAYGFLSWHRYFLYRFELQLRTYVAGIDAVLGLDRPVAAADRHVPRAERICGGRGAQRLFRRSAPGTSDNSTPAPLWWPAGLAGWTLPAVLRRVAAARCDAS